MQVPISSLQVKEKARRRFAPPGGYGNVTDGNNLIVVTALTPDSYNE